MPDFVATVVVEFGNSVGRQMQEKLSESLNKFKMFI